MNVKNQQEKKVEKNLLESRTEAAKLREMTI